MRKDGGFMISSAMNDKLEGDLGQYDYATLCRYAGVSQADAIANYFSKEQLAEMIRKFPKKMAEGGQMGALPVKYKFKIPIDQANGGKQAVISSLTGNIGGDTADLTNNTVVFDGYVDLYKGDSYYAEFTGTGLLRCGASNHPSPRQKSSAIFNVLNGVLENKIGVKWLSVAYVTTGGKEWYSETLMAKGGKIDSPRLGRLEDVMRNNGYELISTGGDATAYLKQTDSADILITAGESIDAPESLTDVVTIGCYPAGKYDEDAIGYQSNISLADFIANEKNVLASIKSGAGKSFGKGGSLPDEKFSSWKNELISLIQQEAKLSLSEIALNDADLKGYFEKNLTPRQVYFDEWQQDAGNFYNISGIFPSDTPEYHFAFEYDGQKYFTLGPDDGGKPFYNKKEVLLLESGYVLEGEYNASRKTEKDVIVFLDEIKRKYPLSELVFSYCPDATSRIGFWRIYSKKDGAVASAAKFIEMAKGGGLFDVNKPLSNIEDVKSFFRHLYNDREVAFHPDDSFSEYVETGSSNKRTFTDAEAAIYDARMNEAFDICNKAGIDIYSVGIEMSQELGIFPFFDDEPEEKMETGGTVTLRHKHIPTLTIKLVEPTSNGWKVIETDPAGIGKVKTGKTAFYTTTQVKELFNKESSSMESQHKRLETLLTLKGDEPGDPAYVFLEEKGDKYVVVNQEKLSLWQAATPMERAEYYEEWVPKSEFLDVILNEGDLGKTKLVVVNENTLGYIDPNQPDKLGVLSASKIRGSRFNELSSMTLLNSDKIRLASKADFDDYRVVFDGYEKSGNYLYSDIVKKHQLQSGGLVPFKANGAYNVLSLNFDKKTNQAIGGTYNGEPIEEYYTYFKGKTTPLPKFVCELIDFLNSK